MQMPEYVEVFGYQQQNKQYGTNIFVGNMLIFM